MLKNPKVLRKKNGQFKKGNQINLGRIWTQESRDKIKKAHTDMKRPPFSKKHRIGISIGNKGKKRTEKFKLQVKKRMTGKIGKESHNWKGGITPLNKLLREKSKWKIWREKVFLRDNFTCQNKNCEFCKNKQGVLLHPHHIKPLSKFPELVYKISNGITYCAEYHIKSGLHRKN